MIKLSINANSDILKFQQIVNGINNAIAENKLHENDQLPSVNAICKEHKLSRDTVFKAYKILKEQGIIVSIPQKGYFISKELQRIFLLLDTFKAYKEVLYGEFIKHLPNNVIADVNFHHYNIDIFRTLISESQNRYSKYIIMPFDHKEIKEILSNLPTDKTLIIDWDIHSSESHHRLFQNFGTSVSTALHETNHLLKKYRELIMVYPEFTDHPYETVENFEAFCQQHKHNHSILKKSSQLEVKAKQMYFSVSDRILGKILEQCREKKLVPGKDVGILSYNETPMKKFIFKGISVISTDFRLMGQKAAEFATNDISMNCCVPTKIIFRESL